MFSIFRQRLLSVFFLLSLAMAGLKGVAQQLYLRHFTVDEGLPSNEVYQVTEDRFGRLLIATDRGAARYDGYAFETIPHAKDQTTGPVYYIYKNQRGLIYFSGLQGAIYEYRQERLFDYPYNRRIANQYQHSGVLIANTLSSQGDSLWISYNNDYTLNLEIGSSLVLPGGDIKKLQVPEGFYFDLQKQFHYRQINNARTAGLRQAVTITWQDGQLSQDSVELDWPGGYVRRLFSVRDRQYELFSIGRNLLIYENRKKIGRYRFPLNVLSFALFNEGEVYVGFENGGVGRYLFQNGALKEVERPLLPECSVTSIYRDRQGGIWFSTLEDGLYYAPPSKSVLRSFDQKIMSIDHWKDDVYIGRNAGLIDVYRNGVLRSTKRVPLKKGEYLLRFSFQLSGQLIVITNKGYHLQKEEGWAFVPSLDLHIVPVNEQYVFGSDRNFAELHVYKGLGGPLLKTQKLTKRVISTFKDSANQLWLGTWEGLFKYENGALQDFSTLHPVFRDRIVAIRKTNTGWLAVASLGKGLVLMKGHQLRHLATQNGLLSPVINSMQVRNSSVFLGTNKGLTRVDVPVEGKPLIEHYGSASGLPTLNIQDFTVDEHWLYAKWVSRLFVFPLKERPAASYLPTVILLSVLVNGEEIYPLRVRDLNYQENNIAFTYNSIDLAGAQGQTYQYRLEGFEPNFHVTTERRVNYTNLPPGHYVFTVKVRGSRNQVSEPFHFALTIQPAFWQQTWFPWTAGFFLLAAATLFFRIRLRVSKEKDLLKLHLAESNQRALIQLINPHFISNLLNTVHAAILKQDKMGAATIVSRFAKLMRMTMELGKEKYVLLHDEISLLQEYMHLEQLRAPGRFDYVLHVDPRLQRRNIYIPGMLIQPFIENAIQHGVMHLEDEKGLVTVRVSLGENQVICQVVDNGIGRTKSALINANKGKEHTSSGINITLNRLKLLHKEQGTVLLYQTRDKHPPGSRAPGTEITFSIPYKLKI